MGTFGNTNPIRSTIESDGKNAKKIRGKLEERISLDLKQHDLNARIRIELSLKDLANSSLDPFGINLNSKAEGMNMLEKAFDHATIGLNYDATVMGFNFPGLHGLNVYAQVRSIPQNIILNHYSGNNPGEENLIFLIGAESGNIQHDPSKNKRSIPLSKIGVASQILHKGIGAMMPGVVAVGGNLQFKPNPAMAMIKNSVASEPSLKQSELPRPIFLLLIICKLISDISSNHIFVGISYRFNEVTLSP